MLSIGNSLGVEFYEVMAELIGLEVFVSPPEELEDTEVMSLGERIGVDFIFDEEGGTSKKTIRPITPSPRLPSADHQEQPTPSE